MAEIRDRERRRRKRLTKERDDSGPTKPPIILAKPGREREKKEQAEKETTPQPTILLKSQVSAPRTRKDSESPHLQYQIAIKPATADLNWTGLVEPVKLIDDNLTFCDSLLEFLTDNTDFLVVGVVGLQGVGKSTLMSALARGTPLREVFPIQSEEQTLSSLHKTVGVDVFVTPERLVLLDTQPLLSSSIMERLVHVDKKHSAEYNSLENTVEMHCLQMLGFLYNVCHVVILAQNWFFDANLIRLLQTAEMLKPGSAVTSQDGLAMEYFPHLVFVHTCTSDFSPNIVREVQETYGCLLQHSQLCFESNMGLTVGRLIPGLSPAVCGPAINLFLLPNVEESESSSVLTHKYHGHPGYNVLVDDFRRQILATPRKPLTGSTLTEKSWFHFTAKMWETTRKSTLYMEYSRFLP